MPGRGNGICKSTDEEEKGGCEKLKKGPEAEAKREKAGKLGTWGAGDEGVE